MIKFILYLTRIVMAAVLALLFASCKYDVELGDFGPGIKGDGNIVTENRNNDTPFTAVEVHRGLELELVQSDKNTIEVVADKNLQNHISTRIENGVLEITSDVNIRSGSKKIIVHMPKITSVQASSAALVTGPGTIKGSQIAVGSSSGSTLKLTIEAENLSAESSSGSNIELKGKALKFETTSSSGSTIEAGELLANDVRAKSSSGSSTEVHALQSLDANASSGSNVTFKGKPNSISKDESSGGSVSQQ